MKKKIILSLLAASVLSAGLMGCGNQFPEIPSEVSSVAETSKASTPQVSSAAVKDPAPKHVTDFYNSYVTLKEKHGFSYDIVSAPKQTTQGGSYGFDVKFSDDSYGTPWVTFFGYEKNTHKSMTLSMISFSSDELNGFKDFVTATFLTTALSLSLEDATTKMAEVTNSYSKDSVSEVVSSGDYLIFLVPNHINPELIAKHKDEIWDDINKADYKNVVFDEYNSPIMNQKTSVKMKGTVLSRQRVSNPTGSFNERLKVKSLDDGHTYNLTYDFNHRPITLSEGTTYDFYGFIYANSDDSPGISVLLVE